MSYIWFLALIITTSLIITNTWDKIFKCHTYNDNCLGKSLVDFTKAPLLNNIEQLTILKQDDNTDNIIIKYNIENDNTAICKFPYKCKDKDDVSKILDILCQK